MINITNFDCLINPKYNKMYSKDVSKSNKLEINYLQKKNRLKNWSLSKFML